jgi:hypothetical protein
MPDADTNYPPKAMGIALKEIKDLQVFIDLCMEGLEYPKLAALIHDKFGDLLKPERTPTDNERMERLKLLEDFASEQAKRGFPYLHCLALVRLWTILEVYIQDIIVWTLSNISEVRELSSIRKIKGPLIEFSSASLQRQSEFIVNVLYDDLSARLKRGVGRFEDVLNVINLGGSIEDNVRKYILEIAEIRNIIVHNNGFVDDKFINNCPWLSYNVGDPILISNAQYLRYFFAVSWYIIEIDIRHSLRYPPEHPEIFVSIERTRELQGRMLKGIYRAG